MVLVICTTAAIVLNSLMGGTALKRKEAVSKVDGLFYFVHTG